jgi:hypothetical protein
MRASARERESVFQRPAHLDALVAAVEGGHTYEVDEPPDDDGDGRRDRGRQSRGDSGAEMLIEEAQREAEVARLQNDHLNRQLKGAIAELELHKRHAKEYKAALEAAEADLSAAHEHVSDLSQKLQVAQEANRRNADMAQQLLTHLNAARVELKSQVRKNEQLQLELSSADLPHGGHGAPPVAGAPATDLAQRRLSRLSRAGRVSLPDAKIQLWDRPHSRAALKPVTHDQGVQVNLAPARSKLEGGSKFGSVAMIAMQHARELEDVHRELQQRVAAVPPTELAMERRPEPHGVPPPAATPGPPGPPRPPGAGESGGPVVACAAAV